ncbi:MAG: sortase [Candidatus Doudnabacteria bacterium]
MKTFFSKQFSVILVAGFAICLLLFLRYALDYDKTPAKQIASAPVLAGIKDQPADYGQPLRLVIPSLNVDAAIENVGETAGGAMDVPKRPEDVGWYDQGPKPGQEGSSVIAGHLDWTNGKAAVFYNLNKLVKGDMVQILTENGESVPFAVRETRFYDFDAKVPEVYSSDSGAHLNLVTCAGVWDKSKKTYSKRFVVFADLVDGEVAGVRTEAPAVAEGPPIPAGLYSLPAAANETGPCGLAESFTGPLKIGSSGSQVVLLQSLLKCLGYIPLNSPLSDSFQTETQSAVREFQKDNGLDVLGNVGPATRKILNSYIVL